VFFVVLRDSVSSLATPSVATPLARLGRGLAGGAGRARLDSRKTSTEFRTTCCETRVVANIQMRTLCCEIRDRISQDYRLIERKRCRYFQCLICVRNISAYLIRVCKYTARETSRARRATRCVLNYFGNCCN